MFCSLPDRLAEFSINTCSSRSEALPDGAGAICLADASLLTLCVSVCVRERERERELERLSANVCVWSYTESAWMHICRNRCIFWAPESACAYSMCIFFIYFEHVHSSSFLLFLGWAWVWVLRLCMLSVCACLCMCLRERLFLQPSAAGGVFFLLRYESCLIFCSQIPSLGLIWVVGSARWEM